MMLCIEGVLEAAELQAVRASAAKARFVDGRATAGWSASLVKRNLQIAADEPALGEIARLVEGALRRSELFAQAAAPRAFGPLLVSRADVGMGYGTHVDDALMGAAHLRTDLAYTLFLTPPEAYEGGTLVVESAAGEVDFKLAAGSLVLYPASFLHRVETVTGGSRLAAVGWVQSCIRDAGRRELLFDLQRARRLVFAESGKSVAFDLMSKTCGNLLRLWAEV